MYLCSRSGIHERFEINSAPGGVSGRLLGVDAVRIFPW